MLEEVIPWIKKRSPKADLSISGQIWAIESPALSVIIPTFNNLEVLKRCLASWKSGRLISRLSYCHRRWLHGRHAGLPAADE